MGLPLPRGAGDNDDARANHDGNDRLLLKHYTMNDIDIPTLECYRQRFHNKYPDHPFNNLDHTEFLRRMGGFAKDREHPFKMKEAKGDDDTPQHKAVLEVMTNAIIHADLMLNGVLKVEKYDDNFVFTNPGLLRLPMEQIDSGNETRARN